MQLGQALAGEIVACDSVQVYRGFDIGSAKPSPSEQQLVRHHLIDVTEAPAAEGEQAATPAFDAEQYAKRASTVLDQLSAANTPAIICGGTGLYLRALRYGLLPMPPSDPRLRAELEAREAAQPGFLVSELLRLDRVSAAAIDPRNLVYLCRAVEICHQTGEPASRLRARHGFRTEQRRMRVIYLDWPREGLRQRIGMRVRHMLEMGLVAEVRNLLRHGVDGGCRPMAAVGYRQTRMAIADEAATGERLDPEQLIRAISTSTGQYAKRQRTWFRKEAGLERMPINSPVDLDRLSASLIAGRH